MASRRLTTVTLLLTALAEVLSRKLPESKQEPN